MAGLRARPGFFLPPRMCVASGAFDRSNDLQLDARDGNAFVCFFSVCLGAAFCSRAGWLPQLLRIRPGLPGSIGGRGRRGRGLPARAARRTRMPRPQAVRRPRGLSGVLVALRSRGRWRGVRDCAPAGIRAGGHRRHSPTLAQAKLGRCDRDWRLLVHAKLVCIPIRLTPTTQMSERGCPRLPPWLRSARLGALASRPVQPPRRRSLRRARRLRCALSRVKARGMRFEASGRGFESLRAHRSLPCT